MSRHGLFSFPRAEPADAINRRLRDIERRLATLETRISAIENQLKMRQSVLNDAITAVTGDEVYPIPALAPTEPIIPATPPWTGRGTLVTARLTSQDFTRATCREVIMWTTVTGVAGGIVAITGTGPWYSPLAGAAGGFVLLTTGLLIYNRVLLYLAVREQAKPRPRHKEKVKTVEITELTRQGKPDWMAYLYLNEADRELFSNAILEEIALRAVTGGDLTIRGRVGGIVSDGPWKRLMSEWIRLGWMTPARGNRPPHLTRRGTVHLTAMAGLDHPPNTTHA